MTKEELKQYLKENLKFEVKDHNKYPYLDDDRWDVSVKLEDEEITKFSLVIKISNKPIKYESNRLYRIDVAHYYSSSSCNCFNWKRNRKRCMQDMQG